MKIWSETIFDGKRALIVDDDMHNAFALSKALRDKGLKVSVAASGARFGNVVGDAI